MTARFAVTLPFGDYVAANLLYQRRYWLWSGLLKTFCFGVAAFFLVMLGLTAWDGPLSAELVLAQLISALAFGLFMVVFIPLLSLVTMRLKARRMFEQLSMALPIAYQVDAKGLRAANGQGTVDLAWDAFVDFVQDKRLLLVRRATRVFLIVPKSQLTDVELDTLLALLRQAGVKES